jgi:FkbM family methyltransferase
MTRIYACALVLLVRLLTGFLPRWRRLTVLARLTRIVTPVERVVVGGRTVSLVVPDRTSVYWARRGPASEPATLAWIDGFAPDDVFVDIGANVGLFSLYAGKRGLAQIVAIEANPFSVQALARNIVENELGDRIIPVCVALSAADGVGDFTVSGIESGTAGNTLLGSGGGTASQMLKTAVTTLDHLLAGLGVAQPSHIKLDVDGNEFDIIRGARQTLANDTLKSLMVEIDPARPDEKARFATELAGVGFVEKAIPLAPGEVNCLFVKRHPAP